MSNVTIIEKFVNHVIENRIEPFCLANQKALQYLTSSMLQQQFDVSAVYLSTRNLKLCDEYITDSKWNREFIDGLMKVFQRWNRDVIVQSKDDSSITRVVTNEAGVKVIEPTQSEDELEEESRFTSDYRTLTRENCKHIDESVIWKQLKLDSRFTWNIGEDIVWKEEIDNSQRSVQFIQLNVGNVGISTPHPIKFNYRCAKEECAHEYKRYYSDVMNVEGYKSACSGHVLGKDGTMKMCGKQNSPDDSSSVYRPVWSLNCHVKVKVKTGSIEDMKSQLFHAISFAQIQPGLCRAAILVVPSKSGAYSLFILAVEEFALHEHQLPQISPHVEVVQALVEDIDSYIQQQTNLIVEKFYLPKTIYVLQRAWEILHQDATFNVLLMGPKDIGKSFVFMIYQQVLYKHSTYTTLRSISIPALRGSVESFWIMNKEQRLPTIGLLGAHDNIFIDEIFAESVNGKFPESSFVEGLKSFALEQRYHNDKVGGDSTKKRKIAEITAAANFDPDYIHMYTKMVKAEYDKLRSGLISNDYPDILPNEDLFLPEEQYSYNVFLQRAINSIRIKMGERAWQCGIEKAILRRFYIIFYIKKAEIEQEEYNTISLINNAQNTQMFDIVELKKNLVTHAYDNFFKSKMKYNVKLDPSSVNHMNTEMNKLFDSPHWREVETSTKKFAIQLVFLHAWLSDRSIPADEDYEFTRRLLATQARYVNLSELHMPVLPKLSQSSER